MPKSPEELKEGAYHVSERILSDFKNGVTYSDAIERITDYWLNIIAQDRAERTGCCGKCYGTNAHNMNEHECINKSCPCHTPLTQRTAGGGVCLRKNMCKTDESKIDNCMNCAGPCTCTHTPVDEVEWEIQIDKIANDWKESEYPWERQDALQAHMVKMVKDFKELTRTLLTKVREATYKKTAQYVLDSVRLAVKAERASAQEGYESEYRDGESVGRRLEREEILREVEGMKRGGAYLVSPVTQKNVDKRDNYFFNIALAAIKEIINKRK